MHFRYISKKKKEEREILEQSDNHSENSVPKNNQIDDNLAQWENNLCPLCAQSKENTKHVVVCPNQEATTYRHQQFQLFSTWLTSQRTDPSFRECVLTVLTSPTRRTFFSVMETITTSRLHLSAAQEQDEIGTVNFLFGRISKKWR